MFGENGVPGTDQIPGPHQHSSLPNLEDNLRLSEKKKKKRLSGAGADAQLDGHSRLHQVLTEFKITGF